MDPRRAPARVIGYFGGSTPRVLAWPDRGWADGGIPMEIAIDIVPADLRIANSEFVMIVDGDKVTEIERHPGTK